MAGKFVTFEGTDGSGKTSVIKGLLARLDQIGLHDKYLVTREPGGSRISEAIREVILDKKILKWIKKLKPYFMRLLDVSI